jgi:hypothetical protein
MLALKRLKQAGVMAGVAEMLPIMRVFRPKFTNPGGIETNPRRRPENAQIDVAALRAANMNVVAGDSFFAPFAWMVLILASRRVW